MRILPVLVALFFTVAVNAQAYKTKKVKLNDRETCYVRKPDINTKEGAYTYTFQGKKLIQGNFASNKRVGKWLYEIDDYQGFGNYVNNERDGVWLFLQDGRVISRVYYTSGIIDSAFSYWNDGTLQAKSIMRAVGPGSIEIFHRNGKLRESMPLLNNTYHGKASYYFKDGKLHRELLYRNGRLLSVISTFDPAGDELDGGDLNEGNGSCISYDFDRVGNFYRSAERSYVDTAMEGPFKSYNADGKLRTEGVLVNDTMVGDWIIYNDGWPIDTLNYNHSGQDYQGLLHGACFEESTKNEYPAGFPGGETNLFVFLDKIIEYPEFEFKHRLSGEVRVSFVVYPDGSHGDYQIVQSSGYAFSEEVLRVIEAMPIWSPAIRDGRPAEMRFTIPVTFDVY